MLRSLDQIDDEFLIRSLNPKNNKLAIFKTNVQIKMGVNSNNGGRSGSFFFFTQDNNFLIKTISHDELKVMVNLVSKIIDHRLEQQN